MGRKTVKVTEDDHQKLKREAEERDVPIAAVVNQHLDWNRDELESDQVLGQNRDLAKAVQYLIRFDGDLEAMYKHGAFGRGKDREAKRFAKALGYEPEPGLGLR